MKRDLSAGWLVYGVSAIAILSGLLALDAWRPVGLEADYGIRLPDRQRLTLARRQARLIDYPHYEQLLTPYLESWRVLSWGFPKGPPLMDITWRGILAVRGDTVLPLGVDAVGSWSVRVGGETLDSTDPDPHRAIPLAAGDHPVVIHFQASTSGARFRLTPRDAPFYPSSEARDAARRRRVWLTLATAGALAVLLFVARAAPRRPLRHAAIVFLVVLAVYLRLQDRSAVPHHNATADEYYHIWAGRTLLETGTPRSWSNFQVYPSGEMQDWFGHTYRLVSPWLDQPPMFTVLVGLWDRLVSPHVPTATYGGPRLFDGPALGSLRVLPILLSCAALMLVHDIGRRLHGWSAGAGAALLYATTPMLVPLHRLLKAENLLALLGLGVVTVILARRARPAGWHLVAIAGLCAAAPLVKLTGLFIPVMALLLLWPRRGGGRAGMLAALVGGVAGVLCLLVYAAIMGWDLFWAVTIAQGSKPASLLNLARLIYDPHVLLERFGPGWIWWLWIAALPALARASRVLAPGLVVYLTAIAASAHQSYLWGWYSIPLYGFLVIPAAAALRPCRFPGAVLLFWVLYVGQSLLMVDSVGLAWPRLLFTGGAVAAVLAEIAPWRGAAHLQRRIAWALLGVAAAVNVDLILHLRSL